MSRPARIFIVSPGPNGICNSPTHHPKTRLTCRPARNVRRARSAVMGPHRGAGTVCHVVSTVSMPPHGSTEGQGRGERSPFLFAISLKINSPSIIGKQKRLWNRMQARPRKQNAPIHQPQSHQYNHHHHHHHRYHPPYQCLSSRLPYRQFNRRPLAMALTIILHRPSSRHFYFPAHTSPT